MTGGANCDMQQMDLQLTDHQQEALTRVTRTLCSFARENDDADIWFRLGDGNAAVPISRLLFAPASAT